MNRFQKARCQFHQCFYIQIFQISRTNFVSAAFSSYVLALAKNSDEKLVQKTLMKLTAGVNFINVLSAPYSYESILGSFSLVTVKFEIFWRKNIGAKDAQKMLMKLNTGHFIIIKNQFYVDMKRCNT
jgi:hypothetical protein